MSSHVTLWLTLALCVCRAGAQTPSPPCLTGIINAYTPVYGFGCDSSSLQVGPVAGFAAGDKVLLIQVQVPQVDLSNSPNFGALLNSTCIGNYEFNRILSINGNNIQLQFDLIRPYDISGKLQLVRVPEYDTAMVCGITCLPWNGNTGGVLALDVKTQLTLNAPIDVSGRGFRGGIVEPNFIDWFFGEQEYFYPPLTTLAAQKGEGIVLIPQDHSFGRGRAGNGGGGGNAHNAGGGGGGNAGAGGDGGLEITNLPSAPTPNTNGLGGATYFSNNPDKILLGGGGGAGHANDTRGSSGGNGGGIVFLTANTLQTNGFQIMANGVDIFGGAEENDGQGGGGGGGAILLDIGQINGTLVCEVKGGRGGSNPYTPAFQLHGPGGGGGGGKLLLAQNSPNVIAQRQGGFNGLTSQNLTNGAMAGSQGSLLTNFVVPTSTLPSHPVSSNLQLLVQSPDCTGISNGQIGIFQSSALLFQINGGPWQPDSVFTNLAPGAYQIGLQFSGGCTLDTSAFVQLPIPLIDTLLMITDATCTVGGAIVVNAVSGTAPFEFQLNNGAWMPSGVFQNLPAGNHTITLRDGSGCTLSSNYTIDAASVPSGNLTLLLNPSCVDQGAITLEATAGTPPFVFQLNGSAWQSNGIFTNLPAGNYTIVLADGTGCSTQYTYSLEAPPQLADTLMEQINATCVAGGSLFVEAINGTFPYAFSLNGGAWQSTGLFTNLPVGNHTISLVDAAGCSLSHQYNIAAPPALVDSLLTVANASCIAGGNLAVQAISGSPPYSYSLNGGAGQSIGTFTNLPVGSYTLDLLDAAGCSLSQGYTIGPPPAVTDTLLAQANATCLAGGSLLVQAISGSPPYTYSLNGGALQSSGAFANLPAGSHTISITDNAGCSHSNDYSIEPPPPLFDTLLAQVNATCVAGGSLLVQAIAGSPPYTYSINGGAGQSGGAFVHLPAGSHTISITDNAGCSHSNHYSIEPPPLLFDTLLAQVNATCTAGGSLLVQAIAGSPPYNYSLNGGTWQAGGAFSNLPAGSHTISIADSAGCSQSHNYTIEPPPPIWDTLLSLVNATCVTGGSLHVQALDGSPPFSFSLNGGPVQANGAFSDLAVGANTISIYDNAGCSLSHTYNIQAPPPLVDTLLAQVNATCVAAGSLSVQAISGTAPYIFQLNGGAGQNNGVFTNLPSGLYQILLRDAAGCTLVRNISIMPPPPARDSLLALTELGCGALGSLAFQAVSGTAPYQFQVNNGAWQTSGLFQNLGSGTYTVVMRDGAGCTVSSMHTLAPYIPLQLALDSIGMVDCRHDLGYLSAAAIGGNGGYFYELSHNGITQTIGYFTALEAGVYSLLVMDSEGCEAVMDGIEILNQIDSVTTFQTVIIYEGAWYELPDGQKAVRAGQYPFLFQSTDGCDSLHIIDLIVQKRHVYVPNIFSPNDDGQNDFFTVYSDASLENVERLQVYDRWGELVFEKQNFAPNVAQNGWDGNYRGRPLNPGMFVWVVNATFVDGLKLQLKGDVTLFR